jgi:hypothetical protein
VSVPIAGEARPSYLRHCVRSPTYLRQISAPDALTSTFMALEQRGRGDVRQPDGTRTTRFRPSYLKHAA